MANIKNHRLYNIWRGVKRRCNDKNNVAYPNYGGRGITICDEWMDFNKFVEDMYLDFIVHSNKNGKNQTTLERVDNNRGYCYENCKWATYKEQNHNRRDNVSLEIDGVVKNMSEWADEYGIERSTFRNRMVKQGKTPAEALTKQGFNRKYLTYKNKKLSVADWSRETGISTTNLYWRIKAGWKTDRILTPKL